MTASSYYHVTDGEWVQIPFRGFKEQCCSCGHVHSVDFRIVKGKLQFRAVTDNRATAAARRIFKFSKDE
jgi:hypothetical protein